jgi:hypothetical protein
MAISFQNLDSMKGAVCASIYRRICQHWVSAFAMIASYSYAAPHNNMPRVSTSFLIHYSKGGDIQCPLTAHVSPLGFRDCILQEELLSNLRHELQ